MKVQRNPQEQYRSLPKGTVFRLWGFDSYGGTWTGERVSKQDNTTIRLLDDSSNVSNDGARTGLVRHFRRGSSYDSRRLSDAGSLRSRREKFNLRLMVVIDDAD